MGKPGRKAGRQEGIVSLPVWLPHHHTHQSNLLNCHFRYALFLAKEIFSNTGTDHGTATAPRKLRSWGGRACEGHRFWVTLMATAWVGKWDDLQAHLHSRGQQCIKFTLFLTQSTSHSPQWLPVPQNTPVPSGTSISHAEDTSLASGNSLSGRQL